MTKVVNFEGIGEVHFVKTKASKRISISLRPFKPVRVSIPHLSSFKHAVAVVESKKEWILKSKAKIQKIENKQTLFTEESEFSTKYHKLVIRKINSNQAKAQIRNGIIKIMYPEYLAIENPELQSFIKKAVEEALRIESKRYLPQRLGELAVKHKFKYSNVSIRNSKTRWGSCSGSNSINLSLHLMRLPDHLIDFVILHELVHTKIKNHSAEFYKALDAVSNNKAMKLTKELKNYRTNMF